ncbi:hypothetical protein L596_010448 [Steinernema carpocapsae]|uniref:Uncharacterized protein n=1 Tax=Steinernema carpocapsae TaxID=34508 RepID=A0A4U5PIX7_STECR|nr:hypothetical protein L596_010448 [Steinernema carpocapsae]
MQLDKHLLTTLRRYAIRMTAYQFLLRAENEEAMDRNATSKTGNTIHIKMLINIETVLPLFVSKQPANFAFNG